MNEHPVTIEEAFKTVGMHYINVFNILHKTIVKAFAKKKKPRITKSYAPAPFESKDI